MKTSFDSSDAADVLRRANLPDAIRSAVNILLAAHRRLESEVERLESLERSDGSRTLPTEPGYYRLVPSLDQPLEVEIARLIDGWWVLFGEDCPLDSAEMSAYLQTVDCTLFPLDLDLSDGNHARRVVTGANSDESPVGGDAIASQTCSTCTRWRDGQCWFVANSPHVVDGTYSCMEWSDDVLDDPRMDGVQWIDAKDVTQAMLDAWPVWEWYRADHNQRGIETSAKLRPDGGLRPWVWRPLRLSGMNRHGEIRATAMTLEHFERVTDWQWMFDGEWKRMNTMSPGDDRAIAWTLHCGGPWARLGMWRPAIFAALDTTDDAAQVASTNDESAALDAALRDLGRSARRLARKIKPMVPDVEGYYAVVYASSEPTRYQGVAQLLAGGVFWRLISSARDFSASEMKRFLIDNDARLVRLDLDRGTSGTDSERAETKDPRPGRPESSWADALRERCLEF